jgi:hypothetical protein
MLNTVGSESHSDFSVLDPSCWHTSRPQLPNPPWEIRHNWTEGCNISRFLEGPSFPQERVCPDLVMQYIYTLFERMDVFLPQANIQFRPGL